METITFSVYGNIKLANICKKENLEIKEVKERLCMKCFQKELDIPNILSYLDGN